MKVFITGICGFVGSSIANCLKQAQADIEIFGIDNLMRRGSENNVAQLESLGIQVLYGDMRQPSDLSDIPSAEWVIDAAALTNVTAGVQGSNSSRQLIEHNLVATLNLLEYCRANKSGLILLSTSRVYSIEALTRIALDVVDDSFVLADSNANWVGLSLHGIGEEFTTRSPISLYGATKLSSETIALEYGAAYGFPVWVNRCGVMAGAGQTQTDR